MKSEACWRWRAAPTRIWIGSQRQAQLRARAPMLFSGVFGLRAAYFTDPQGLAISSGVPSMGKGQGQSFQPMQSLPYNPYAQGKGSGKQDFAPFGSVRSFQEGLQPTELCSHWLKSPELCQNGDLCPFAHGVPELRPDMAEQQRELVSRFLHTGFKPKVRGVLHLTKRLIYTVLIYVL